jgi:predicted MFS family arabinose efflux permease
MAALMIGALFPQLPAQLCVLFFWTASQFIIWPALEALVTEGESGTRRAQLVGVYSVVWASCSAISYFLGGTLYEHLGSGSIFWLPPGLHLIQLAVFWSYARKKQGQGEPMREDSLTWRRAASGICFSKWPGWPTRLRVWPRSRCWQ